MEKELLQKCNLIAQNASIVARDEIRLFCQIMDWSDADVYFVADDPHGVVSLGDYFFNMSDIHVVISEYEHWMEIYKTNEELRKAVDAWYYYCINWHNLHSYEEPRWVSVKDRLPKTDEDIYVLFGYEPKTKGIGYVSDDGEIWYVYGWGTVEDVTHWKKIISPEQEAERSKGCPNLRSWLAGCPVDGLRDATLEWQTQRERDLQAALSVSRNASKHSKMRLRKK